MLRASIIVKFIVLLHCFIINVRCCEIKSGSNDQVLREIEREREKEERESKHESSISCCVLLRVPRTPSPVEMLVLYYYRRAFYSRWMVAKVFAPRTKNAKSFISVEGERAAVQVNAIVHPERNVTRHFLVPGAMDKECHPR